MNWCDKCPLRLFNTKCHNLEGIGNPWANKVIVVPNVDYDAYKNKDMSFSSQVDIILNTLSPMGEVSDLYILPLIRCNETVSCEVNNEIVGICLNYFAAEVRTYQWKHIMLCGEAAKRFLSCELNSYLDTIIISRNKRIYSVNYSPLVKYTDNDKFDKFQHYLIKWYNNANENSYPNYASITL